MSDQFGTYLDQVDVAGMLVYTQTQPIWVGNVSFNHNTAHLDGKCQLQPKPGDKMVKPNPKLLKPDSSGVGRSGKELAFDT